MTGEDMALKKSALGLLLALAATSLAAQQAKWGPHLDFEAKPGSKRSLGEGDLFVPLMQDERTLLFGNLRARFDDQSSREGNLGLGVRRMLEGGWNVGGYGYLDRRKTELGNYYNQTTLGGEALGRDWDFRANAYLPRGERVRQVDTADTASISGTTVLVSSVTREERALKGFDAEVGWRVPMFDVDGPRQLRLYAGGYRFKDDVAKLSGPRLRAELTVAELPQLYRGAQLIAGAEYQDDNVRGGQAFLSVRLRVPLGGDKGSPRTLNWQERRMTAPVMRDVDIVAPVIARAPVVETASALADGRAFTVLSSETTAGAALPGAVTAAGANSVVILSGTFNTVGTTTLQAGQTLAGSILVRTASGRTAMTPSATIAATPSGAPARLDAVTAANNSTITGLTISSTASTTFGANGVLVTGVTGVTIMNNTITATETGNDPNAVVISAGGSATVIGNRLTAIGAAIHIPAALNVFNGTVAASGNTLSATGSTIAANNRAAGFGTATIISGASTGNVKAAGVCQGGSVTGFLSFTDGTTCP